MKKFFLILLGIFVFVSADEFLLQLPFSQAKAIKESPVIPVAFFENSVIGRIGKEQLNSLNFPYRIIASLPVKEGELFYIVYHSPYLRHTDARAILAQQGEILAEDGDAFFVRAREEKILSILHLGFEIAHVSLLPVILPVEEAMKEPEEIEQGRMEDSIIREIINRITPTELAQLVRELSGEVPVTVRGRLDTIRTRYVTAPKNSSGIWYIYEKFQSYNLDSVSFHGFTRSSYNDSNVIGTKVGTTYPEKYFIIGGHCDATSESPSTYAPGADDNASGTVAAIIAAKYMSPYRWKYTIRFIAWNAEEVGLYGSDAHAALAQSRGDSIKGVLNADMIATEMTDNDSVRVYTGTRATSRAIGDTFFAVNERYDIGLKVRRSTSMSANSDHYSYYSRGYNAVHIFEDDFCPYYHSTQDRITASSFDTVYFCKVVKAMVATLATFAQPDTPYTFIAEKPTANSFASLSVQPNPFRKWTTIYYQGNKREPFTLALFSSDGRLVKEFSTEKNSIIWDGRDEQGRKRPGVYFLRMRKGKGISPYKLTLIE